jgi:NAD(P)-dependent dehydrogenase (short-subunit alcohol dehydrogenase family)
MTICPREEYTMLNQDQVCIVTGGGKGIGKGIAKVLAAEGATVVVAGRSEDLLRRTAADIVAKGGQAAARRLDITDRPGVAAFVQEVRQQFGRIDVLVNNAGLMPMPGNLATFDDQLWDDLFAVNATGTYNMTKAVLPAMLEKKSGRIINISSVSAKLTWPAFVAYGAAKAALHAFTTALAKEVASDGITVNCVLPGFTRTEEMERIWGTIAHNVGQTMDELVNPILESKVPIKRWLQPEEIGYMVSFLASSRATGITGQMFVVDGGLDAHD